MEKILAYLKENFKADITEPNNIALQDISFEMENAKIIDFTLEYRESDSDSWLQAEHWNSIINHCIIVDYDVECVYDSLEDFAEELDRINQEVNRINSLLKK